MKILLTFILFGAFACSGNTKKTEKIAAQHPTPDTMTIVFSGDYMQHTPQISAAKTDSGYNYCEQLRHIAPLWKSADFSIINLETTLSHTPPFTGYPQFRSPAEIATSLEKAGITHLALSNNHALDRGYTGVIRTAQIIDSTSMTRFGVWLTTDTLHRSYTMLCKGALRVAVLNHTYGTNGMPLPQGVRMNTELDTTALRRDIQDAKMSSATHIIAFVHWGDEYVTYPNAQQRKLALWLRKQGVNAIVGSHPHTAQPIDHKNSTAYSLGNFVSNQRKINTDTGLSVKLTVTKNDTIKIEHTTHFVDISTPGPSKYRVLSIADTTFIENLTARKYMIQAIERAEKIIATPVKY